MTTESDPPILSLSVKVYQGLLIAYPGKFRKEYEAHMVQVFQDCSIRALHQRGADGIMRLWAITLLDFFHSVFVEYLQKEALMSKSQFIRLSSWAIVLGSFGFLALLTGSDPYALSGSVVSSILLAIGMLGLWARTKETGRNGGGLLLAGVVGMVLLYLFLASGVILSFFVVISPNWVRAFSDGLWILLFGGPVFVLLGLILFGLAALQNKPVARYNWLPVLAGIWYPAFYLAVTGYLYTHHGYFPFDRIQTASSVLIVTQFLALFVFGMFLAIEPLPEMAMT